MNKTIYIDDKTDKSLTKLAKNNGRTKAGQIRFMINREVKK